MHKINLFDIQKSSQDIKYLKDNSKLGLDIATDIIDSLSGMPILGSLLRIGKIGLNVIDLFFIRKLAKFIEQSDEISEEEKNNFLSSLDKKDYEHISSYLLHLLYISEEEEKARIMGMIYKARILNEIDNDMMLRLCSIVYKSFLLDFKKLPFYKEQNKEDSIEANNFINLGLIDNFVGGVWIDEPSWKLNDIGNQLYEILNQNKWFDENEK
jgi:hypothetical protein